MVLYGTVPVQYPLCFRVQAPMKRTSQVQSSMSPVFKVWYQCRNVPVLSMCYLPGISKSCRYGTMGMVPVPVSSQLLFCLNLLVFFLKWYFLNSRAYRVTTCVGYATIVEDIPHKYQGWRVGCKSIPQWRAAVASSSSSSSSIVGTQMILISCITSTQGPNYPI